MKGRFLRVVMITTVILMITIVIRPSNIPAFSGDTSSPSLFPTTGVFQPGATANPIPARDTQSDLLVVKVYYLRSSNIKKISSWLEPWEVNPLENSMIVGVARSQLSRLEETGFRLEVDWALTEQVNRPLEQLPNQTSGIPGYPCYRTVEETYTTAQELVNLYPTLASWIDIGDSWEKINANAGSDLWVLRLTNSAFSGPKPKLFIMASIHAREYAPAELATRFAEYLLGQYAIDPDITWLMDYHEIHLLLQANPDGRKLVELGPNTDFSWWRKNTDQNYCLIDPYSRGADLNRNFSFHWGCCGGSSSNPCDEVYRGSGAVSEPETSAIQEYLRFLFPDQREPGITEPAQQDASGIFIDLHSYGKLVLWPWGFTAQAAPNSNPLRTLGKKLAYFNEYEPMQSYGLYPTDGTTEDFAYGELGLASYIIEVGSSFFVSCTNFENIIFPSNQAALLYALKAVRLPYQIPSGPEVVQLEISPGWSQPGTEIQIRAQIDDARFFDGVFDPDEIEPIQAIQAVEAFVDVPPWITTTAPMPITLAAEDGIYDQPIEWVSGTIPAQGLAKGRHTLFVHGQDQAGNWGAFQAGFFDVPEEILFFPWVAK